ncbi:MAG: hypothetical protein JOY54_18360 [Acidobacteriaceae bacterium]|nr:hypothetical protein [Acidobacteriaceae bacterium]
MRQSVSRWMVWWYIAIAAGFVLLAIVHMVTKDNPWLIAVRLVIAAGFGFLAWFESHSKTRRP